MGMEFIPLFDEWADSYDQTVAGADPEYAEVFSNYDHILQTVASEANGVVLEFGVGTGNLSEKLLNGGLVVYGVEPAKMMRNEAKKKLPSLSLFEGDFLSYSLPIDSVDTIVSTYAFHHLNDVEKEQALKQYYELLNKKGKILFADTLFESSESKQKAIRNAKCQNYNKLAEDLMTEHYTTLPILKEMMERIGFQVHFKQMNPFVWIIDAVK
ncbi:class I SAM-dependent methyltransferase [Bacillus gobiensis]|uniref:class I SAM-dependent methyltransferase n=1 Tax=Bacillus gobiensis TaxID=1441095 RepID=UPI003D2485BE